MTSAAFQEWRAYLRLEDEEERRREERADRRSAIVAWTLASIFRGKGQRAVPLETFVSIIQQRHERRVRHAASVELSSKIRAAFLKLEAS